MKLIVGLGNPGRKYKKTRHNIGFMFLDEYSNSINVSFKLDKEKKAEIAEYGAGQNKVILLKPYTYMNLSGEAIRKTMNYYNISQHDLLVIYDDMSLPLGIMRIREKGSDGGHNGIKSIIKELGTNEFMRIKVGIGSNEEINNKNYVLGKVPKKDMKIINELIQNIDDIVELFLKGNTHEMMNKYSK